MDLAPRMENLRFNIERTRQDIRDYEDHKIGSLVEYEMNLESILIMKQNLSNMQSIVYGDGHISIMLTRREIELTRNALKTAMTGDSMDKTLSIVKRLNRMLNIMEVE